MPVVGNFAKSVKNDWNALLAGGGGDAGATAATTALLDNGHTSNGKSKGKKVKKGGKRPRSEIGQGSTSSNGAATTPDFFSAKRAGTGLPRVAVSSGKKRKRTVVGGGAGPPDPAAGGSNGSALPAGTGSKQRKQQQKRSDVVDSSKRPRSNALNLAFQAQKEQAATAAAAVAVGGKGAQKGGDKGRGGGRKGASEKALTAAEKAQYVALDCEMVGVGPRGCRSVLARCCLVDWDGNVM